MTPPGNRLRTLLAEPGFVVMPAVWDGLSAKLSAAAGFKHSLPFRLLRGRKPPGWA